MNSFVIDIQRCSIHDGPGIRTTVFLKGCPLRCKWCHNPESQSFQKELSFHSELCTNCGQCVFVCKTQAHKIANAIHSVDLKKCNQCGACTKVCKTKSLTLIGKEMSPQEVFNIVVKDKAFYAQGNGGLTISGGEALSHIDFCIELLKLCNAEGIHTCIETSGYAARGAIEKVSPYVDLFLFDFKVSDEQIAQEYIGGSLELIHHSFESIYNQGNQIILRCPIIPNVNDTIEHFHEIGEMTKNYPKLHSVELLPYHNFGVSKGNNIGKVSEEFNLPTQEQKQEWIAFFESRGHEKVKFS
ncbi:MAG: glycyl-radical enzyme activating protein [Oscillospiraceae bacterium]